jgi:hypothetical protein
MIVILGALVFCLGSARPGLAAQADPPGKKPPPAPTAPIFTLLDNNGNQVGTVVGFLGSGRVMTRVPVQDSRAITHNIGLLVSQNFIFSTGQSLFFQSVDCSGTPFILVNTANANTFLHAF